MSVALFLCDAVRLSIVLVLCSLMCWCLPFRRYHAFLCALLSSGFVVPLLGVQCDLLVYHRVWLSLLFPYP